jgi:hypothetical protein
MDSNMFCNQLSSVFFSYDKRSYFELCKMQHKENYEFKRMCKEVVSGLLQSNQIISTTITSLPAKFKAIFISAELRVKLGNACCH